MQLGRGKKLGALIFTFYDQSKIRAKYLMHFELQVHHLVGVAVTPVVCFLGEIGESQLNPNPVEVAEVFTVPLELFLDRDMWIHKLNHAPFFTGGPHIIWGLTAYIVNRFVKDIIERYDVVFEDDTDS